MKRIICLLLIFLCLIIFSGQTFSKDSYWGVGYTIEQDLHGYVGTVQFHNDPTSSKFAFNAINNRVEVTNVNITNNSVDTIRLFSGTLEEVENSDGFVLIEGKSYGLEFSSQDPIDLGGANFQWGYFTGVKLYDWDAIVRGDEFTGKHWVIPGGVDFSISPKMRGAYFALGVKLSMAFGMMNMDNVTTGESYGKITFGYEYQYYATIAVKI
ncbi:MAG: hypothetical protein PHV06_06580 [bacterium]|nr:hypothetical protein [bacterium]